MKLIYSTLGLSYPTEILLSLLRVKIWMCPHRSGYQAARHLTIAIIFCVQAMWTMSLCNCCFRYYQSVQTPDSEAVRGSDLYPYCETPSAVVSLGDDDLTKWQELSTKSNNGRDEMCNLLYTAMCLRMPKCQKYIATKASTASYNYISTDVFTLLFWVSRYMQNHSQPQCNDDGASAADQDCGSL